MNIQIKGKSGPKFVLLSAHDTNIVLILNFLKASLKLDNFTFTNIEFASNVLVELNKNESSNNYYLKIVYNDQEIYSDDFDKFVSNIEKYYASSTDLKNLCGDEIEQSNVDTATLVIYWVIIASLILLITALIINLSKITKNPNISEVRESMDTV